MKTCLLICSDLHAEPMMWYKNILNGNGVNTYSCHTMSKLHEIMSKKHKRAIVIGEKLPHTVNSQKDSSNLKEIISLLSINGIHYLVVNSEKPDTVRVLKFIKEDKTFY